jgi:hypothetical protein
VKIEEDMLSIEDILESPPSFPFEINSRVHMASFCAFSSQGGCEKEYI